MKVCWFGLYEEDYSRNGVLISGLKKNGVEVIECNSLSSGGFRKYINLVKKLRSLRNEYDFLYCAFPTNYNVIIASMFQKKPIIVDAFFPLHEAYVVDRGVVSRYSPRAFLLKIVDYISVTLPLRIVVDTEIHKDYWSRYCNSEKIVVIPVGADTRFYKPLPLSRISSGKEFNVLFHGSYIPLQGVDVILDAVEILDKYRDITFTFIGSGQTLAETKERVEEENLPVTFFPWLDQESLNLKLNNTDVVLGIFGSNTKTDRVIPNKVFQGLAVKKPVITKATPIVDKWMGDVVMVCDANGRSLANSILELYSNQEKRNHLAEIGYQKFKAEFTPEILGKKLMDLFMSISKI